MFAAMMIVISLAVLRATALAQDNPPERELTGVWEVTTTPRDCATGIPLTARAFRSIWTFNQDGTMTATNVPVNLAAPPPSTATIYRLAYYGIWKRKHGWSDYVFKFVHLRFDGTTRAFAGKQEGTGDLIVSETGDDFITDGTTTAFDVNDIPGTPGCGNSVGTRFKMD